MSNIITVNFRNDTLFAVEREDGVFIALKPICDRLGLDWAAQLQRLKGDEILTEGMVVTTIPSSKGPQETTCLRLDLVNGWLFTISDKRVKPECREIVLAYKRECYAVLFEHFYTGKRVADEPAEILGPVDIPEDGPFEIYRPMLVKLQMVTQARKTHSVQAARELWIKIGLPVTPAMTKDARLVAALAHDGEDSIGRFLQARTRSRRGARVSTTVLYNAFTTWAEARGEAGMSHNLFSRGLRARGFASRNSGTIFWADLELFEVEHGAAAASAA